MCLDRPNNINAIPTPNREKVSTGFLPNRSAARPQKIINIICVREKTDS